MVSWGVSIPTSSAGGPTSSNAAVEPLAESAAALRYQLESLATPASSVALEHEHLPRGRCAGNDVERVEQRRPRQAQLPASALHGGVSLVFARPGQRFLGDHQQSNGFHPAKLIRSGLQKTKAANLRSVRKTLFTIATSAVRER